MESPTSFEDMNFKTLDNISLEGREFVSCAFTGINFTELRLKKAKFIECSFKECNLSNVDLMACSFRDVDFDQCKLVGVNWSALSSIFELRFHDCHMDYSVFQELKLPNTIFEKCLLRDADFHGSDLRKARFTESDLSSCFFSRCNLEGADFREAKNYSLNLNDNKVRKAKFSLPEAVELFRHFEIEVE